MRYDTLNHGSWLGGLQVMSRRSKVLSSLAILSAGMLALLVILNFWSPGTSPAARDAIARELETTKIETLRHAEGELEKLHSALLSEFTANFRPGWSGYIAEKKSDLQWVWSRVFRGKATAHDERMNDLQAEIQTALGSKDKIDALTHNVAKSIADYYAQRVLRSGVVLTKSSPRFADDAIKQAAKRHAEPSYDHAIVAGANIARKAQALLEVLSKRSVPQSAVKTLQEGLPIRFCGAGVSMQTCQLAANAAKHSAVQALRASGLRALTVAAYAAPVAIAVGSVALVATDGAMYRARRDAVIAQLK